jgi:TetR/AcrR family transcriptional repressor of nem operon
MRLSKDQVEANRRRVLAEAARLFRERGFEGIGVAELMQSAGFTHGGFYNHFASKTELAAEVTRDILVQSTAKIDRIVSDPALDPQAAYGDYVARYLSIATRDNPGRSCPIAALGADVGRQDDEVRRAFAEGLKNYIESFATMMPASGESASGERGRSREEAIFALSTLVGAIVLARAVAGVDEAFSQQILEAAQGQLQGAAHAA